MRPFNSSLRSVTARIVLLLLAPHVTGCVGTSHVAPGNGADSDKVVGLTTKSGREITFAVPGVNITHDTLYAVVKSGQLIMPVDSVRTLSVRHGSDMGTVALVLGVGLVVAMAVTVSQAKWQCQKSCPDIQRVHR